MVTATGTSPPLLISSFPYDALLLPHCCSPRHQPSMRHLRQVPPSIGRWRACHHHPPSLVFLVPWRHSPKGHETTVLGRCHAHASEVLPPGDHHDHCTTFGQSPFQTSQLQGPDSLRCVDPTVVDSLHLCLRRLCPNLCCRDNFVKGVFRCTFDFASGMSAPDHSWNHAHDEHQACWR